MATLLRQSTAVTIPLGPFLDEDDGKTAKTALTINQADIRVNKNGGAWAQKSQAGGATHQENGWYSVALNATDTNTLGCLIVHVHVAGALPVWREFLVVPANVYDSMVAGSDNLQVDTVQFGGSNGTFSGGRPEVNTSHWGGTAVASANVLIDGAITAAKIDTGAITADKIASGALTAAKFAAGAFDAVWSVATRELTAGTNIVLAKGTGITGFNDLDAAGVRAAVGLSSANLDTQLGTINSNVDAILEDTGTTIPSTLSTISGKIDTVDGVADAIKAVTDNLPDSGALTSLAQASALATVNGIVDEILARLPANVDGYTFPQVVTLIAAALLGKASGLDTTTAVFRSLDDTKDRITATVDSDGNRAAVTLDPT